MKKTNENTEIGHTITGCSCGGTEFEVYATESKFDDRLINIHKKCPNCSRSVIILVFPREGERCVVCGGKEPRALSFINHHPLLLCTNCNMHVMTDLSNTLDNEVERLNKEESNE